MSSVNVGAPRPCEDGGWPGMTAPITVDGRTYDIFYRVSQGAVSPAVEPFLAAALLPAMRTGADLRLEGSVSPRLLERLPRLQGIFCTWFSDLYHKVAISPKAASASAPAAGAGTGAFFTSGIDSFYTALKHRNEISTLIFIHGFDISLERTALREKVSAHVRQAAAELGKPLLEVETNVRQLLNDYADWNVECHGAALASAALALTPQLQRIFIGATHSYDMLAAHGSHPLVDPLWSTEQLEIIHDGAEKTRWQKLESLLDNPIVRRHLHSCWEYRNGDYNCGHCSSCLRTRAFLRLHGVAEQFPTYPHPLDLDELAHLPVRAPNSNYFTGLLLQEVERKGTDPELTKALRTALSADPGADIVFGTTPEARDRILQLTYKLEESESHLDRLRSTEQRLAYLETRVHALETSRSWRWTAPLRAMERTLRQRKEKV
jgi:hypothetical protein